MEKYHCIDCGKLLEQPSPGIVAGAWLRTDGNRKITKQVPGGVIHGKELGFVCNGCSAMIKRRIKIMKISEIVKQTKEYERLNRLICAIEEAVKDFDSINTVKNSMELTSGYLTINGGLITSEQATRRVDVRLDSEASELVRDDVKAVLEKHLAELKLQRDGLEI